jgi:glycine cleavage system H protein
LENNPELVNDDPYGEGWMIKIRPDNAADIDSLLSADEYQSLIS